MVAKTPVEVKYKSTVTCNFKTKAGFKIGYKLLVFLEKINVHPGNSNVLATMKNPHYVFNLADVDWCRNKDHWSGRD